MVMGNSGEGYDSIEQFLDKGENCLKDLIDDKSILEPGLELGLEKEPDGYVLYVEGDTEDDSEKLLKEIYGQTAHIEQIQKYCAIVDRNGFTYILTRDREEL